ncbi:hypothetical protein T02_5934 [Trichinella nativa]|uniref:Uncharacterized protein n=1 Tax=Trichinella nativa TaxID=6335 RepID=A0A0V1LDC3_9BILA|nr:hypothetical protein T02_5934 [Trichinella nativa]
MSCDVCLCLGVSLSLKLFGSFPTRQQINGNAALLLEQRTAELKELNITLFISSLHILYAFPIIYSVNRCCFIELYFSFTSSWAKMRSLSIFTVFCLTETFFDD